MTCAACGAVALESGRFCSACGRALVAPLARPTQAAKWYYNVWFVLLMLFFVVGPFGLPLVWKNPRFPRWLKITLTLAMIAYTALLVDLTIRMTRAVLEHVNEFNASLQF